MKGGGQYPPVQVLLTIGMNTTSRKSNPGQGGRLTTTLERGLRVLQCFDTRDAVLSNSEITRRTGLPKATVSRLSHTLVQLGYLKVSPDNGQFILGIGVLCLGYPLMSGNFLSPSTSKHLSRFAQLIDGTATISVRDHLRIVSLQSESANDVLRRRPGVGLALPFCGSTAGLAWLIGATDEERGKATRELHYAVGDEAVRKYLDLYRRSAAFYRREGYVTTENLVHKDTAVFAKSLYRRPGEDLLILSCAISTRTQSGRDAMGAVPRLLAGVAEAINGELKKPARARGANPASP